MGIASIAIRAGEELTLIETDPFYSEANMTRLAMSKKQITEGNIIYKTALELGLDDE